MLKAKFFVEKCGNIVGFDISGHSGYAELGSDIVCAAVSSVAYMVANTLIDVIGVQADVVVNEKVGRMRLEVDKKDIALCRDIFNGFKSHLIMLGEVYPDNINVSYVEV